MHIPEIMHIGRNLQLLAFGYALQLVTILSEIFSAEILNQASIAILLRNCVCKIQRYTYLYIKRSAQCLRMAQSCTTHNKVSYCGQQSLSISLYSTKNKRPHFDQEIHESTLDELDAHESIQPSSQGAIKQESSIKQTTSLNLQSKFKQPIILPRESTTLFLISDITGLSIQELQEALQIVNRQKRLVKPNERITDPQILTKLGQLGNYDFRFNKGEEKLQVVHGLKTPVITLMGHMDHGKTTLLKSVTFYTDSILH